MTDDRGHSQYTSFRNIDRLARLRRMRGLARLMDMALRIPEHTFRSGRTQVIVQR